MNLYEQLVTIAVNTKLKKAEELMRAGDYRGADRLLGEAKKIIKDNGAKHESV